MVGGNLHSTGLPIHIQKGSQNEHEVDLNSYLSKCWQASRSACRARQVTTSAREEKQTALLPPFMLDRKFIHLIRVLPHIKEYFTLWTGGQHNGGTKCKKKQKAQSDLPTHSNHVGVRHLGDCALGCWPSLWSPDKEKLWGRIELPTCVSKVPALSLIDFGFSRSLLPSAFKKIADLCFS